jgi:hypothetical protein
LDAEKKIWQLKLLKAEVDLKENLAIEVKIRNFAALNNMGVIHQLELRLPNGMILRPPNMETQEVDDEVEVTS